MLVSFKPPTVDDNLLGVPLESSSRLLVLDGHPSAVGRAVRGLFAGVIRSLPCSWLAVGSGGAHTHGAWENADECRVRGTAPPALLIRLTGTSGVQPAVWFADLGIAPHFWEVLINARQARVFGLTIIVFFVFLVSMIRAFVSPRLSLFERE